MKKAYLLAGLGAGILAITAISGVYAASNNYDAWRTSMANNGGRAATAVTEQNFDQYTAMHQLMVDGKYEEAQKVRTELGLGQGRGNGYGTSGCGLQNGAGRQGGCGMRNGTGEGRGTGFVDKNNNGICDLAEKVLK
ncbi:MAG: hypothetical protein WCK11_03630 [Candidatus Falkowbacteria bacterium]